jgi:protein-S-isoprenylcysteine O-methyltransferase Ste14
MHGQKETSNAPRIICAIFDAAFLGFVIWLYLGDGLAYLPEWLKSGSPLLDQGPGARHFVLIGFGVVLFLRMTLAGLYILQRKFGWDELVGVTLALFIYQVGFALLALSAASDLDPLDYLAVALFLIGSWLNTGSELQRKRFKDDPSNAGKLYTGGLFRYARHINYFGDILWVGAWAMVTRNPWAALVPIALTAGFIFAFIPPLAKYLRDRYGEQYQEWERTTKKLVPFLY